MSLKDKNPVKLKMEGQKVPSMTNLIISENRSVCNDSRGGYGLQP